MAVSLHSDYEPNTGGVVNRDRQVLDVHDDCLYMGSKCVARLNPNMLASELEQVRRSIKPVEFDASKAVSAIMNDLTPDTKAGLVRFDDVRKALKEFFEKHG